MKSRLEQLLAKAKEVQLTEDEKARTREVLWSAMHMDAVREEDDIRHKVQKASLAGQRLPITKLSITQFLFKRMVIAAVLLIAIAAGGGVSLAAEDTAPGDVLYSFKVGVNENVRSALAFSGEAKAEWKIEQVERRLHETEKLAVKGSLDTTLASRLETMFEQHAEQISQVASRLEAEGKVEAATEAYSNLEAVLDTHEKILERIRIENLLKGEGIKKIIVKINLKLQEVKKARVEAEEEVSVKVGPEVQAAAEGKLRAAQNKIAEVKSFLEKTKIQAGNEVAFEAQERLKAAKSIVLDGQAKIESKEYGEAFVLFQEAMRMAQEAKSLLEVGANLKIDLKIEAREQEEQESQEKTEGEIKSEGETEANSEVDIKSETKIEIGL